MAEEKHPHVVVFPYPGQGHINPLMQLSIRLSSMGSFVTFVTVRGDYKRIMESWSKQGISQPEEEELRMAFIPDDALPPRSMEKLPEFAEGTKKLKKPFEEFMKELVEDASCPPVSCVVFDAIFTWIRVIAETFGVHWVPYYPFPAAVFLLQVQNLAQSRDEEVIKVPGLVPLLPLDFPRLNADESVMEMINDQARHAPWLFINTCETLERDALQAARELGLHNIVPVAPMLPASFVESRASDDKNMVTGSLWEQDGTCIEWLNMQSPCSVLYISFGSIYGLLLDDLEELLTGVVSSGVKFLWVLRPDLVPEMTKEKHQYFLDKFKDHGLVVHWSPQLKILRHPAVAVFLTHCGWNSTFESIIAGVPMICWPCKVDQMLNAKYVVDVWKVGMRIADEPVLRGNIKEEDVRNVVVEMVQGSRGKTVKERAGELSRECRKEFEDIDKLKAFVRDLKNAL